MILSNVKLNTSNIVNLILDDSFVFEREVFNVVYDALGDIESVFDQIEAEVNKVISRPDSETSGPLDLDVAYKMSNPISNFYALYGSQSPYDAKMKYRNFSNEEKERLSREYKKDLSNMTPGEIVEYIRMRKALEAFDNESWYRKSSDTIEDDMFTPEEAFFLRDILKVSNSEYNQKIIDAMNPPSEEITLSNSEVADINKQMGRVFQDLPFEEFSEIEQQAIEDAIKNDQNSEEDIDSAVKSASLSTVAKTKFNKSANFRYLDPEAFKLYLLISITDFLLVLTSHIRVGPSIVSNINNEISKISSDILKEYSEGEESTNPFSGLFKDIFVASGTGEEDIVTGSLKDESYDEMIDSWKWSTEILQYYTDLKWKIQPDSKTQGNLLVPVGGFTPTKKGNFFPIKIIKKDVETKG